LDDLRQTRAIRGQTIAPQIEFFCAREQKTCAGAVFDRDLHWFLFLFEKRKRKTNNDQNTLRTVSRLPLKIIEIDSLGESQKNLIDNFGVKKYHREKRLFTPNQVADLLKYF
jgi:hypothetical protein